MPALFPCVHKLLFNRHLGNVRGRQEPRRKRRSRIEDAESAEKGAKPAGQRMTPSGVVITGSIGGLHKHRPGLADQISSPLGNQ